MRPLLATLTAFFLLTTPAAASWTWPVSGEIITPYRNGTDPYASGQHRGIDIAAPTGAPVVAAAGGEIRFAGAAGSSGLTVSIRTGDGYDTSYLHLSSLAVRAGGRVDAGDRIGAVGTTGTRSATQPHLHFGVRDAGSRYAYHDPLSFLPPPPASPRAPDPPPAATAPEPAPAPPAAAPAPAHVPQATPRPAPRRPPVARAPAGTRAPRPVTTPRHVAVPHAAPNPNTAAPAATRPAPHRRRATKPARATWAAPQAARGTHARATAARAVSSAAEIEGPRHPLAGAGDRSSPAADGPNSPAAPGPNLGWALACAGLLLAAGLLGLTEGGRRSSRQGRGRLPDTLRPLLGRR